MAAALSSQSVVLSLGKNAPHGTPNTTLAPEPAGGLVARTFTRALAPRHASATIKTPPQPVRCSQRPSIQPRASQSACSLAGAARFPLASGISCSLRGPSDAEMHPVSPHHDPLHRNNLARQATYSRGSSGPGEAYEIPVEVTVGVSPVPQFTEDKARLLRQRMREAESYHDTMYHSGLASRLA